MKGCVPRAGVIVFPLKRPPIASDSHTAIQQTTEITPNNFMRYASPDDAERSDRITQIKVAYGPQTLGGLLPDSGPGWSYEPAP